MLYLVAAINTSSDKHLLPAVLRGGLLQVDTSPPNGTFTAEQF
jgi:hypothetical protein